MRVITKVIELPYSILIIVLITFVLLTLSYLLYCLGFIEYICIDDNCR
jgi:hypothetical protein